MSDSSAGTWKSWRQVAEHLGSSYGLDLTAHKLSSRIGGRPAVTWGDAVVALADAKYSKFGTASSSATGYFLACLANYFQDQVLAQEEFVRSEKMRSERAAEERQTKARERTIARGRLRDLGFRSQPDHYFGSGRLFTGGPGDGTYNQDCPVEALAAVQAARDSGTLPPPVLHAHPSVRDSREALRVVQRHVDRWSEDLVVARDAVRSHGDPALKRRVAEIERELACWRERLPDAQSKFEQSLAEHPERSTGYR